MRLQTILKAAATSALALTMLALPAQMRAQAADTVLKAADVEKQIPTNVYYRGQQAPTQLRNAGGVKFADGYFLLAALVDTSGYSTDVQAKYSGWLAVETPIKLGGKDLAAGVYGLGFIGDNKFVITDVGGHDVLTVNSGEDAGLKRPMPLQVLADPAGGFRLYAGRRYVSFSR